MAGKKDVASPEDAIAAAMSTATLASGAASLPAPGDVPEALARGAVVASNIVLPNDATLQAGQYLEMASNSQCNPAAKMQAEQIAAALAAQAPPAPPTQVAIGQTTVAIPASVRLVPHRLHTLNASKARQLWSAFLGDHKKRMAELAAQGGNAADPFVWLAQQLIALIEIDNWYGKKLKDTPSFDHNDQTTKQGLLEWAGPDLTRLIVRDAERLDISIVALLGQMFARLDEKKQAEIKTALMTETSSQWAE